MILIPFMFLILYHFIFHFFLFILFVFNSTLFILFLWNFYFSTMFCVSFLVYFYFGLVLFILIRFIAIRTLELYWKHLELSNIEEFFISCISLIIYTYDFIAYLFKNGKNFTQYSHILHPLRRRCVFIRC